jgi:hypothetical protein
MPPEDLPDLRTGWCLSWRHIDAELADLIGVARSLELARRFHGASLIFPALNGPDH